jgi:Flp pilus assembly protein CpaB
MLSRGTRRALWRSRFLIAAACLGIASAAAVQALAPPSPAAREIVVPARRIEAGSVVEAADLRVVSVAAELAPSSLVASVEEVVGRTAVMPLVVGVPFSAEMVSGGEVASRAPAGTVVVPVRLGEATSALLTPGDRVDLVSTDALTGQADYVARRALVLPSPARASPTSSGLLGGGAAVDPAAGLALLAVRPGEAAGVAIAASAGSIGAVIVP